MKPTIDFSLAKCIGWLVAILVLFAAPGAREAVAQSASPSASQSAAAKDSHLRIESMRGRMRGGSFAITVDCKTNEKFTDGAIYLMMSEEGKAHVDSMKLWSGTSDSASFANSIHYAHPAEVGRKSRHTIMFVAHVGAAGSAESVVRDLFSYRLADTLLLDEHSYAALDKAEVDYLVRKKGYSGKSEDEIKTLDPELWKKMENVKKSQQAGKK